MKLLGIDLGSSSIKVAVVDSESGKCLGNEQYPKTEMAIQSPQPGWAEQDPENWWQVLKDALLLLKKRVDLSDIGAIGIAYQMHGLVAIDADQHLVRPSIIWCDSRAVNQGDAAFAKIGSNKALSTLLNSPGNFTASKLGWVKHHEPEKFEQIKHIMLPGDYLAMKLSGAVQTTASGLSEGIFWDFQSRSLSEDVIDSFGFEAALIPELVPNIGIQCQVSSSAADELGIPAGIPIAYRAGDQPNNALSLNVFEPGEVATTAGTSAVIYAVDDQNRFDPTQRVNSFLHVIDTLENPRNGVLLCVNGCGILYSWLRQVLSTSAPLMGYDQMNQEAAKASIGSEGLQFFPFGNGAERLLGNQNVFAHLHQLDLNRHDRPHLIRAAQEGIVFAMNYGLEVFQEMGIDVMVMKAGMANLFQSDLFQSVFVNTTGVPLQLLETDGAEGAARAAGVGIGNWSRKEAFDNLKEIKTIEPNAVDQSAYTDAYQDWKNNLAHFIKH
ncbi:MAG: FGGY family carbohydrate kinase [Cytophagales bacterium]|nr:FGGY family carbohydrate kinase [Cytophagales bacterium]